MQKIILEVWMMLQQKKPDDYVIATGKSYTVREFVENFKFIGINIAWKGKGLKEVGYNSKNKQILIKIDKNYFRPNEVFDLRGDYKKAKKILKWRPKKIFRSDD